MSTQKAAQTKTVPGSLVRKEPGIVFAVWIRKKEKEKKETIIYHTLSKGGDSGEKRWWNLLHILQGGEIFLAGADLDHAGHIVNKDLAVADVAGVKGFLGGFDHGIDRDL